MRKFLVLSTLLLFVSSLSGSTAGAQTTNHTVTISGTYDFSTDNACSTTVTTACLKQFNVYDVTPATPVKLGSVAAPAGATTATAAVTGSFAISIKSGIHSFAITAQMADGTESDPKAFTAIPLTVKPGVPVALSLTAN